MVIRVRRQDGRNVNGLKLSPEIIVSDTPDLMAKEAARLFSEAAEKRASAGNLFSVAFSGGSTPVSMNRILAEEPYASRVPWDKTHVFWVDERCVAYSHPFSNYGSAAKDLISKIPIPAMNVHPMHLISIIQMKSQTAVPLLPAQ